MIRARHLTAMLLLIGTASCDILVDSPFDNKQAEQPHHVRSVPQARLMINCTDLWVKGYIVGGNLSNKSVRFEGPFTAETNLAIASWPECAERDSCIAVQLPKGSVRDSLNLVTNPHLLGRFVILKGDVVSSYFGLVGLKNVVLYHFPGPDEIGYEELIGSNSPAPRD